MAKETNKILLGNVNLDTGEHKDGVVVYIAKKHYFNEDHITMFQKALESISASDLSHTDMKVFMFLLAKAGMGNKVFISFKDSADKLGLKKQNFGRSIKNLCDRNIVIKGEEKVGRTLSLRINYAVAWLGKIKDHNIIKMYDSHRPILNDQTEVKPEQPTLFDPQF